MKWQTTEYSVTVGLSFQYCSHRFVLIFRSKHSYTCKMRQRRILIPFLSTFVPFVRHSVVSWHLLSFFLLFHAQILFKYPPGKKVAMRPKDLAAFCFPGGVEV